MIVDVQANQGETITIQLRVDLGCVRTRAENGYISLIKERRELDEEGLKANWGREGKGAVRKREERQL